MNTKDELKKILVNNAQCWSKKESQDQALIYVDDFLNEVESKLKLLRLNNCAGHSEQLSQCKCGNTVQIECDDYKDDRIRSQYV